MAVRISNDCARRHAHEEANLDHPDNCLDRSLERSGVPDGVHLKVQHIEPIVGYKRRSSFGCSERDPRTEG